MLLAGVNSGRSAHRRRQQPPSQKTPASARVIISRANLCQIEKTSPQPGDFFSSLLRGSASLLFTVGLGILFFLLLRRWLRIIILVLEMISLSK